MSIFDMEAILVGRKEFENANIEFHGFGFYFERAVAAMEANLRERGKLRDGKGKTYTGARDVAGAYIWNEPWIARTDDDLGNSAFPVAIIRIGEKP